ncbi:MAG: HipA domain-containing protein [Clostridia bacterium]|nr:HipA domain-containing protein [Clostridia bacterium]
MELMNFTSLPIRKKSYGGANGNKISVVINDELYMLKLPARASKNPNLSYTNSCISEYFGSNIFNMLGIDAQETVLGTFKYNNVERISVACKDFEKDGYVLKDFASVKNQIIDSNSNGYGTELSDILETIQKQQLIDQVVLSNHFWNMFVIDALIGNWDRHNGNWGLLYNQETDDIKLAPIYDCGSCLFPQIDSELIEKCLKDKTEMNIRIFDIPTSAIFLKGKRINYNKFIKSHEYEECDKAINRIKERIDFDKINSLIDEVDCISDKHKMFLKTIIKRRYEEFFL